MRKDNVMAETLCYIVGAGDFTDSYLPPKDSFIIAADADISI
jgi:hypothetical protein